MKTKSVPFLVLTFIITFHLFNVRSEASTYKIVEDKTVTWDQAKESASAMGGHLVSITSAAEQQIIDNLLISSGVPSGAYWIGLIETDIEGIYRWYNGEILDYTNWDPGQPDNASGVESRGQVLWTEEEGAATFNRRGKWNDLPPGGYDSWPGLPDVVRGGYIVESECPIDDSDNDGVPNQWDKCPDTPADSYVDKNGCPATGLYTQAQLDQAVKAEQLKWDANGDGKIGLEDIIRMLQVLVGLKP